MDSQTEKQPERIPLGQAVFDEWLLWFLISLVISFVLYNVWGLLELIRLPVAGQ
ncbi:MAG: hypothetical protein ACE5FI_03880 [Anaerolineales bacterium]